ncbi:MAG: helix-turn-helix domain-containing protein [Kineosporiaceae bacterium]
MPGEEEAGAVLGSEISRDRGVTMNLSDGTQLQLPDLVVEAIADVVQRLAAGSGVVVSSVDEHVTTGRAAAMLGVSRTYVARLLDEGRLPYEYRGTHRRIPVTAVIAYLDERRQQAAAALDDISRLSREAGMYDDDF